MPKKVDLTSKRFGRLTVLCRADGSYHGASLWKCICRCGNECTIPIGSLRSGKTSSCGCKLKEHRQNFTRSHYASFIDATAQPSVEDLDDLINW